MDIERDAHKSEESEQNKSDKNNAKLSQICPQKLSNVVVFT